jgi:hypothetical protein
MAYGRGHNSCDRRVAEELTKYRANQEYVLRFAVEDRERAEANEAKAKAELALLPAKEQVLAEQWAKLVSL